MVILKCLASRCVSPAKGFCKSYILSGPAPFSYRNFSAQSDNKSTSEDAAYEDGIKEKLLEASLQFVNKRGWSVAAISDGANSLGYPGIVNGIFPNPSVELIDYFNRKCNSELVKNMIATVTTSEGNSNPRTFIQDTVQRRLEMVIPYIEKWPQALAIMSIPTNLPVASKTFFMMIDDICYYSGDTSVDFNWYCRRGAVSAIYKSTELCMLQDKSEDFTYTWKFLERRTNEAFQIDKILKANESALDSMRQFAVATFTTMGNILHFNRKPGLPRTSFYNETPSSAH